MTTIATVAVFPTAQAAASDGSETPPILVELFTSQGCKDCPPADALIGELASRPDLIVLSLHVDYWDYIGWKDPYASPEMTARQRAYARSFNHRMLYTPEIVIDGSISVIGFRRKDVISAIDRALARRKALTVGVIAGDGGQVLLPEGQAPEGGATVWLATYDRHHRTPVSSGENAGQTIENFNVVRELRQIGVWMGEPVEIAIDLDDVMADGRDGCVVFVQQNSAGPIIAAGVLQMNQTAAQE